MRGREESKKMLDKNCRRINRWPHINIIFFKGRIRRGMRCPEWAHHRRKERMEYLGNRDSVRDLPFEFRKRAKVVAVDVTL